MSLYDQLKEEHLVKKQKMVEQEIKLCKESLVKQGSARTSVNSVAQYFESEGFEVKYGVVPGTCIIKFQGDNND